MKRTIFHRLCAAFIPIFFVVFVPSLKAQIQEGQSLDKIVAIVGMEPVLLSEVNYRLMMLAQQDSKININDKEIRAKVIEAIINEKLIVTKAIEDSVTVGDEEVNEGISNYIASLVQQLGSEKRVEEVFGMSIVRIKRDYRDEMRKQMLADRIRQQKFGSVKLTQREVEEFYRNFRDSLPPMPAQVDLYHIVINVQASSAVKDEARRLAKRVRDSIIAGGDFAVFAKRYSGDLGSKDVGGDLGFVDRGKFIAEYEKAAFSLQIQEISDPVETPFGFHVIQLLDKRADAVHTRHILFKLGQSTDDVERVKATLDSLKREKVVAGADFETLAKIHSQDDDSRSFGGLIGRVEMNKLPEDLKKIVEKMPDGAVSDPLPYNANPLKPGYHIVWRKKFYAEHKATLNDDGKRIEQMATVYKKNKMYEDWIQELRKTMYWELREK